MMERTESLARGPATPSPEVLEKPVRRRFTVEYKAKMLAEADACTETGQLGELLRREGLYSSHLTTWRRQRENKRLKDRLRQAELIIDVQKKVSEMLNVSQKNHHDEGNA